MKINLKLVFVLIGMLFTSFEIYSQDIIYKKDQTKIECKVIKITNDLVEYRTKQQPDGPIRTILRTDIHQIVYLDGSFEIFNQTIETAESKRVINSTLNKTTIEPKNMYEPNVSTTNKVQGESTQEQDKKERLTKIAIAGSFGEFDDDNSSEIYDRLGGVDVKFVIGLSKIIRLGGFYNKLSADGTPITYGSINQNDTDSEIELKSYGLEMDLYLGKSFYFLSRYGAFKLSEELNVLGEQVGGDLDGAVFSLGVGFDINITSGFGLYAEGMYNWRSLKDFDIDGALNGVGLSGGVFVKF